MVSLHSKLETGFAVAFFLGRWGLRLHGRRRAQGGRDYADEKPLAHGERNAGPVPRATTQPPQCGEGRAILPAFAARIRERSRPARAAPEM
jgi:hypothetical protein